MSGGERGLWPARAADRDDLATFTERALRLDDAAVVRLREREGGMIVAWVATGFDVLASRVVAGRIVPSDLSVGADVLLAGLRAATSAGHVDPGFSMDSAWRGVLPPEKGFVYLDDVPAAAVLDLAERGMSLAKEHSSAFGPPTSLLDQEVLTVASQHDTVGIPMRCVLTLTAMGFLPQPTAEDRGAGDTDEVVRVRALPNWLRVDARFGTVYLRRGDPAVVLR
ncbi:MULTISPECIES: hypothetical protein [Mycolicibacterium]|uniref:Uncharacterized protein n=2 Tax=Mycolicibacterium gilvum TaxID=1804 RepID=A0A378SPB7_9MYCO|nr:MULTISPECIES: hypothetical protein [Mycolicibacterium]ABP45048.1 conserved hypothetical protein [Mycolicibacterium gilvum PYR-GCK]MBV5243083.1 hypothetical protein [Mycolicibacterium sp. PAM1]MCV7057808.1 hypothetical protein [Mycolicibacterium gilvum]STZ44642.1 Uncharacterised protein [Mycolicibacterium gilvum]